VKPEKMHPVDLVCTVILIFVIIPWAFYKLQTFMHGYCMNYEGLKISNRRKEKRNMLRKSRIAKEIDIKIDDLSDYRMFFVGLEEQTSSDEEKKLI